MDLRLLLVDDKTCVNLVAMLVPFLLGLDVSITQGAPPIRTAQLHAARLVGLRAMRLEL